MATGHSSNSPNLISMDMFSDLPISLDRYRTINVSTDRQMGLLIRDCMKGMQFCCRYTFLHQLRKPLRQCFKVPSQSVALHHNMIQVHLLAHSSVLQKQLYTDNISGTLSSPAVHLG